MILVSGAHNIEDILELDTPNSKLGINPASRNFEQFLGRKSISASEPGPKHMELKKELAVHMGNLSRVEEHSGQSIITSMLSIFEVYKEKFSQGEQFDMRDFCLDLALDSIAKTISFDASPDEAQMISDAFSQAKRYIAVVGGTDGKTKIANLLNRLGKSALSNSYTNAIKSVDDVIYSLIDRRLSLIQDDHQPANDLLNHLIQVCRFGSN